MSNDTNYISPNFNAADRLLEPLPELVSDEAYIERRKAREDELWDVDTMAEAIDGNIPLAFFTSIQLARISASRGFNALADEQRLEAMQSIYEVMDKYIQEQAKEDVDNE